MLTRFRASLVVLLLVASACSSGSSSSEGTSTSSSTRANPTTRTAPARVCADGKQPPRHYQSVVVFAFENRTWSDVGLGFGSQMPYLQQLGRQCAFFRTWDETDPGQNSLTQYVGQITGAGQPGTVNDCSPSATCSTTADNIFRQVRVAGRRAVNFVEGATAPCSADQNAPKHVPALYLWAPDDKAQCTQQVRPLTELDVRCPPRLRVRDPEPVQRRSRLRQRRRRRVGPRARPAGARQRRVPSRQRRGVHLVRRGPARTEHVDHADRGHGPTRCPWCGSPRHPEGLAVDARAPVLVQRLHCRRLARSRKLVARRGPSPTEPKTGRRRRHAGRS